MLALCHFLCTTFNSPSYHIWRLVVGTLQKLEPERRCFRLVGGVLVERTVAEVLPAVQKNLEGIDEVIEQLTKSLREKEAELNAFQTKYKIKVRGERDSNEDERSDSDKQSKSQGVLA
eukprot:GEZU01013538.1.p1 GENE.GEZU01013538.1~~GEZU01013538.1.p1  ORF type:complete len:118 (+),score=29.03 GEZU01013538.1:331-684(+)